MHSTRIRHISQPGVFPTNQSLVQMKDNWEFFRLLIAILLRDSRVSFSSPFSEPNFPLDFVSLCGCCYSALLPAGPTPQSSLNSPAHNHRAAQLSYICVVDQVYKRCRSIAVSLSPFSSVRLLQKEEKLRREQSFSGESLEVGSFT
jgi:hypothetical protein